MQCSLLFERSHNMNSLRQIAARPLAAVIVAMMMLPVVASAQTNIKPGYNVFSPEQDVEIGRQSAAEAEQQLPLVRDAQVNDYVNRIGQRLAANAGGPQFQYQFRVVNSTDINAFALPGGFVYINRGVLDQAKNEGEVAGVVAHEIAHVALRHGTHQASKAYLAQAGLSILGGILGGGGGRSADIINAVGGVGLNVLFLKYSRDLETQADVRGAQILAATGYSPNDMVNFFRTLESVDKSRKTSFLADHPAPPDRIARIQREAQSLHVSASAPQNVAQLNTIKGRLGGVTAQNGTVAQKSAAATSSTARRRTQGGAAQPVQVEAPSSSLRSYTAPSGVYRVSYPSNWSVYQQGATGVTFAPKGGIGDVNGRTEIVYGAIVSHYAPFGNATSRNNLRGSVYEGNVTLEDATNDLLATIQRDSPHLRVIGNSGQRVTMANGSALAASLRGTNPNTGVNERVTIVTRQLADDHLVYLLFVTPDAEASRYTNVLNAMVSSMQVDAAHNH
jgi:Zn-dependent protease with chaperone function